MGDTAAGPLLAGAGVGAMIYATVLAGLWWLVGRSAGAEADVLSVAQRLLRR